MSQAFVHKKIKVEFDAAFALQLACLLGGVARQIEEVGTDDDNDAWVLADVAKQSLMDAVSSQLTLEEINILTAE